MAGGPPWLQELKLAEAHLNAGRLADAEAVLWQILKVDPNQADALNALAALALGAGKLDVAIALQRRALAVRPDAPLYWSNLGEMQRRAGDLAAAIEHGKKAVALRPSFAAGHNNLGAAQAEAGDLAAALKSYDTAISHRQDFADAHNNRGNALRALGRLKDAEASLRQAIALRADHAEAHNNLGNVLRDLGRAAEAEAIYRRAATLRPEDFGALFNLSLALQEQGKQEESDAAVQSAMAAAQRALEVAPENAQAANVLGLTYVAASRHAEAVTAFKQATSRRRWAEPWINLGNALREIGAFEDALAAFDRARELAPRDAAPLLGAAQVKMFRDATDPHLAAMQSLERDLAKLPEAQQMYLHFALGKGHDDLGDTEKAFAHLSAGNAIKRQSVAYDEAKTLKLFDRIKQTFDAEFMATARTGLRDPAPIFVVGMPRSGTTLVEQIISSHPDVGAAGETSAMSSAMRTLGAFPESVRACGDEVLVRLAESYMRQLRSIAADAAHITDKAPSNIFFIGLIHAALPEAKIVHVMRDPADTCFSCYSKLFTREQPHTFDLGEMGRYYRAYYGLMQHWRDVLPEGRVLDVRYEDVVGGTEGQARRLLSHCGLDWDERVLSFHQSERAVSTASASQVRRPIYTSSVARWRRYEAHLWPLLDALGDLAPR